MKLRLLPLLFIVPALLLAADGQKPVAGASPTPTAQKAPSVRFVFPVQPMPPTRKVAPAQTPSGRPSPIGTQLPKPAAHNQAAPVQRTGNVERLPEGAKPVSNGWEYTDAQGKTWIYRQTPFGLMKIEKSENRLPMTQSNSKPAN
jgi:hypothetical protein